jgi:hypothetical protein
MLKLADPSQHLMASDGTSSDEHGQLFLSGTRMVR